MIKLIINTSKKNGSKYYALAIETNGRRTYITFDKTTIVKALDLTYSELGTMPIGEYNINEKGVNHERS